MFPGTCVSGLVNHLRSNTTCFWRQMLPSLHLMHGLAKKVLHAESKWPTAAPEAKLQSVSLLAVPGHLSLQVCIISWIEPFPTSHCGTLSYAQILQNFSSIGSHQWFVHETHSILQWSFLSFSIKKTKQNMEDRQAQRNLGTHPKVLFSP